MTDKQLLNALIRAEIHFKNTTQGYKQFARNGRGSEWKAALAALELAQAELKKRLVKPKAKWANIGPVQPGGKSLLDMSLTHHTSGIPLFPAIDTAWGGGGGVVMCAPEDMTVDTKDSHASPGEAFYATGKSGLRYWFGHLREGDDWALGHKFKKGDVIGRTINQSGTDHGHVGVNAEALLGKGKQLKYGRDGNGPDYTLGAPTIRRQLEAALM